MGKVGRRMIPRCTTGLLVPTFFWFFASRVFGSLSEKCFQARQFRPTPGEKSLQLAILKGAIWDGGLLQFVFLTRDSFS